MAALTQKMSRYRAMQLRLRRHRVRTSTVRNVHAIWGTDKIPCDKTAFKVCYFQNTLFYSERHDTKALNSSSCILHELRHTKSNNTYRAYYTVPRDILWDKYKPQFCNC